ncbi:hypothetical protein C8J57DRAFT_1210276 [Mycena rebaudengoi]|nr:hypothetical protein C8J57DRAFT_1210276 [Mycena rebaudengoi]
MQAGGKRRCETAGDREGREGRSRRVDMADWEGAAGRRVRTGKDGGEGRGEGRSRAGRGERGMAGRKGVARKGAGGWTAGGGTLGNGEGGRRNFVSGCRHGGREGRDEERVWLGVGEDSRRRERRERQPLHVAPYKKYSIAGGHDRLRGVGAGRAGNGSRLMRERGDAF